jgi:plastocyanin
MAQQTIVIKKDQFVPGSLRLRPGDSVAWRNEDDHDHTATSDPGRVQFDTGIIKAGTSSAPVPFDVATSYGGVSYFCRLHGAMEGRLVVSAAVIPTAKALGSTRPAAALAPASAPERLTYPVDAWQKIARIVAVHWVYDLADNFGFSKTIFKGTALDQINEAWAAIETFWQQQTGTTKTILDANGNIDPTAFEAESRENLEALGRRIRTARRQLRTIAVLPMYPFPDRPDATQPRFGELYPGQSSDPFGEAVTINFVGVPVSNDNNVVLTDIQLAEVRHETYAGALWSIESSLDAGETVTDQQKQDYRSAREALLLDDYDLLASHLYFGLSKLFDSADFPEAKFSEGIRRMTVRGEWDGSWFPMWHWLRWIDGYLTVKQTGQLPDPIVP